MFSKKKDISEPIYAIQKKLEKNPEKFTMQETTLFDHASIFEDIDVDFKISVNLTKNKLYYCRVPYGFQLTDDEKEYLVSVFTHEYQRRKKLEHKEKQKQDDFARRQAIGKYSQYTGE